MPRRAVCVVSVARLIARHGEHNYTVHRATKAVGLTSSAYVQKLAPQRKQCHLNDAVHAGTDCTLGLLTCKRLLYPFSPLPAARAFLTTPIATVYSSSMVAASLAMLMGVSISSLPVNRRRDQRPKVSLNLLAHSCFSKHPLVCSNNVTNRADLE